MSQPVPTKMRLQRQSRQLEIVFDDGFSKELPCEYLRVFSPSAEIAGSGVGQEVLILGKEEVNIESIEPVSDHGVRIVFDDGHDTAVYTWEHLYKLATEYEEKWRKFLEQLEEAGVRRDA